MAGLQNGSMAGLQNGSVAGLRLLHLCDSLFPIGGFAFSDGLESATGRGLVATSDDLRDWLAVCLDETIGRLEGPTVWRAWTAFRDADWRALTAIDEDAIALRPSSSARRATRAMGTRLLTTWHALHPEPRLEDVRSLARGGTVAPSLPVAFACASAAAGVERRAAIEAFAYTRLASTASAAMRLMPIGQTDAHALLARTLDRVPDVVDAMIARDADAESFTPVMDIAAMTQQYLRSRLFRS